MRKKKEGEEREGKKGKVKNERKQRKTVREGLMRKVERWKDREREGPKVLKTSEFLKRGRNFRVAPTENKILCCVIVSKLSSISPEKQNLNHCFEASQQPLSSPEKEQKSHACSEKTKIESLF